MIEQLTVFIENADGRLTALCRALADARVNMHALVVADTSEYGIVRIICDAPERGAEALEAAGFRAARAHVVGVQVPHVPGGLAEVFAALDEAGLSIEYSYCFADAKGTATVALKAAEGAEPVLREAGFSVVGQGELS